MGNFAVASGHQLTTNAAAEVLRAGGTAVDASIAGALMACVAEPVLASLLSGGFLMVSPVGAKSRCLDAFVQTPKRKLSLSEIDLREIEVDFGQTTQTFHCGAGTIATPGIVPGLFEAHAQFGRISMAELAAPAIEAARNGVETTLFQAEVFAYVEKIVTASKGAEDIYAPNGNLIKSGEQLRNPEMADVIEVMAIEGERFIQEGEVAEGLLSLEGSHLDRRDLQSYRPIWREPLRISRQNTEIDLNPAPSLGGAQIALALMALPENPDDTLLAKCLNKIASIRKQYDLDHHPSQAEEILLNPELLSDLRITLQNHQAATRGTTHISVIDQQGMGASFTLSNGEGCGLIVPGTGIMPNNMLGEDDLVPDGPNSWQEDIRLASMMCPTAIRNNDGLTMMGSGGSNRIRSALIQVALNLIDGRDALEPAINSPRMHVDDTPHVLDFEDIGSDQRRDGLLQAFPDANAWPKPSMYFGGVHAVRQTKSGFEAAGDHRRSGFALTE